MVTVHIEAQLSKDELLQAGQQLDTPDLEQFVAEVVLIQGRRRAPSLSRAETELLLKINEDVPAKLQRPYKALIAKRRAGTLQADEQEELLRLTEQVEQIEVRRVESPVELAQLRGVGLTELMQSLGIQPQH
ncbi:MAG: STAS/SEC14 domain-containing protein [Chloroflexota bacterium]|nr:STAS/SEC14 domain-containing protein [Chloroflexota bacterium]